MSDTPDRLHTRLTKQRAHARRVLWFERVWPALWPAFALIGAWIAAALFDLPSLLPPVWHLVALVAVLAAAGVLTGRGLRRVLRPTDGEVDRRLEANGGVRHRPLVVLADRPAAADPASDALWAAHLRRAAADIGRLRAGWPRPGIPQRDTRAFRAALGVLIVAGVVIAGPDAPGRLLRSLWPTLPAGAATPAPQLQVWLTPPSYTALPPIFLHPGQEAPPIPTGSHLTVNLTGGSGAPTMSYGDQPADFAALDTASWQAERDVTADGTLAVRRRGADLGRWTLTIIPDAPPSVAWTDPPGPGIGPRRLQTRLPWTVADDYGVVSLQAELHLRDRPSAPPLVITLPLPGGTAKSAHGIAMQDLVANPWAGLPVTAVLIAKDAPGQKGTSAEASFTLPERQFKNPLARAVLDIRKRLSLHPEDHGQASSDLSALAGAPEAFDNNTAIFLALSTTAALLDRSGEPADIAEAQARLWSLALQLEDDSVARTAQAVQAARQALQQAMKNGDKTDMDKKADALRREIQKHLQALAEQAKRDGTLMPFDPTERTLNQQDFDKLTQELKDAEKRGDQQTAQEKLQQLERMLDQLKQAEANPSKDRQQARQQRQRGQQQMGAAEDMIQREGVMKGHAAARDPQAAPPQPDQQANQGAQPGQQDSQAVQPGQQAQGAQPGPTPDAGQPGQQGAPGGQPAPTRQADERQQKALRRALGQMMQNFGDLTGKIPDALSQADIAMDKAGQALGKGDDKTAAAAQQQAIDALSKGEQQMSQQMASSLGISVQPGEGEGEGNQPGDQMAGDEPGNDNGQGGQGDRDADSGGPGDNDQQADMPRDPLGRPTSDGSNGRADGGDVHVPDQMERARTREIQAELRKREGERTRPQSELDYIGRLLKPY
jgi:uncharacterized protein (TIGR02302 family)